ncbi:MAG: hypothetical protein ABIQ39_09815 [Ilumatobacteraceae bacterium]
MTTLVEYAELNFPNHALEVAEGSLPLTHRTAVAYMVGRKKTKEVERSLRAANSDVPIGVAILQPVPAKMHQPGEEVVADPRRRIIAGVVIGALVGAGLGVIIGVIAGSLNVGAAAALLIAVMGGVLGLVLGGGGRDSGPHPWVLHGGPRSTVGVVAAYFDEESDDMLAMATIMEQMHVADVRIVSETGAWHAPNTAC